MSINQIIIRGLKKNMKNYYLYIFALIFSSALYFAFVTLQYNPSMNEVEGSIKGAAAIRAASVILIAIVAIFLLYANNIFIKRRSREIGLFQLIGMTKNKIFRILSIENLIIYFGSLLAGIFLGFSISKLVLLILIKVTGVDAVAALEFSLNAFLQTVVVFSSIFVFISLANYTYIQRNNILALFRILSSTEEKVKKVSHLEMFLGTLGILLIITGYYVSSKLFDGAFSTMIELFWAMLFILGSVIIGTYLFYKGSVRFILYMLRKRKDGYLSVNEVLSLSSLMFRMKSNALLLTIITTVSALAIGLLSLSYITYYSAEQSAENSIPDDFALTNTKDAEAFEEKLKAEHIPFHKKQIDVLQANANVEQILETDMEGLNFDPSLMLLPVVSDADVAHIDVSKKETLFTGYNDMLQRFMTLEHSGQIQWEGKEEIPQRYIGLNKDFIISYYFTNGGLPTAIVDEQVFERLKKYADPEIQKESSVYVGISVEKRKHLRKANTIFDNMTFSEGSPHHSQLAMSENQKKNMGLIMFIVGFLGLAFLITSGCILYFKQMDESEEEKNNYTILRKLGFTTGDLQKGIQVKQLFNFGIPLVIGLCHSYFAVQSGWFLFGTEVWTPMILVMVFYTILYSIFGILSFLYSKQIIKASL